MNYHVYDDVPFYPRTSVFHLLKSTFCVPLECVEVFHKKDLHINFLCLILSIRHLMKWLPLHYYLLTACGWYIWKMLMAWWNALLLEVAYCDALSPLLSSHLSFSVCVCICSLRGNMSRTEIITTIYLLRIFPSSLKYYLILKHVSVGISQN